MSGRAVVTGGAGFIGSHLVDRLIDDGLEVAVIDDLSTGSPERLNENALFFKEDVAEADRVSRIIGDFKPDVVFHLAAHADVTQSVARPEFDARVNIIGTINVVKAAVESGAQKFIYTSSAAVYGVPETPVVGEDAETVPVSPYGASKLTAEHYVRIITQSSGKTEYAVLRLANVYGPGQGLKAEAGVISIFTRRILAGEEVVVYGEGKARRDFIFVGDVVEAMVSAMNTGNGTFNISSGIPVSILDVLKIIEKYTGACRRVLKPLRAGEIEIIALDNSKAREELNWQPVITLEAGIKQTVEFWRERR